MKKREPTYSVDGDINWYSNNGEKLKTELPFDPAILLLLLLSRFSRVRLCATP